MWGNWQGWIISALMVLATGGIFYRLANPEPESSPQALLPDAYKPIQLEKERDPTNVMPPGTRSADAGTLYRQAVIRYQANPKPYEDPIHASPPDLSSLELLLQAADCSRMTLFESQPQKLVNYGNGTPELDAILKIASAANTIGLGLVLDEKPDDAKKYFLAVFALGRHLFDERVSWRELSAGLSVMSDASQNLAKLANQAHDAGREDVLRKFQDEIDKYRGNLEETVAAPLSNPVESYASKYAGDIFAIARDSNVERVWRVAAIMHLGRYRWDVADDRKGDQVWAQRELFMLERSIDPKNSDVVILTAIHAALDLKVEQQRLNAGGQ